MVTGIDATIVTVTNGTTIQAPDAMANWNALNSNGVSNDGGLITTDNAGGITAVALHTTGGGTLAFIITTYLLVNNVTINNGNTNNYTCTGVGGIPSGAKAVFLSYYYTSNAGNTFATFTPQGTAWSNGNYPASNPVTSTTSIGNAGAFTVPLNTSNGQIDIKAVNGNLSGLYVYLYGYIY